MIKLNAMRFFGRSLILSQFFFLAIITPVLTQAAAGDPIIISPRAGEAVQGRVEINGITAMEGFQRAEVEFRYVNDPKNSWFILAETDQNVNPGKIAEWDTSLISDGNYDLRLTVCITGGTCKNTIVPGLRVRNYSPVETPTPPDPVATSYVMVIVETTIPTLTPRPTRPAYESNPAILSPSDLNGSLFRGGVVGIGFFLSFGIYWIVKRSLS